MDELSKKAELFKERIRTANPSRRASTLTRRYVQYEGQEPIVIKRSTEDFAERGVVLVDRYTETYDTRQYTHVFSGTCLVLFMDGRLAVLERSGSIRGNEGEWTATMRFTTPEDAVSQYGLEACIERLV